MITSEGEMLLIAIYVDDILLAGKSMKRMNTVKQALLQVKDVGELNYFLGVKVLQDHSAGSVWIGKQSYRENILRKLGMEKCQENSNSCGRSTMLVKGGDEHV